VVPRGHPFYFLVRINRLICVILLMYDSFLCPTKPVVSDAASFSVVSAASRRNGNSIPAAHTLLITKAEDERRWDDDLRKLFSNPNAAIRKRAALAAGRIGDEDSVGSAHESARKDPDSSVRAMAAFALGEVESETGANALIAVTQEHERAS
jgi:HEAT repeat protein